MAQLAQILLHPGHFQIAFFPQVISFKNWKGFKLITEFAFSGI